MCQPTTGVSTIREAPRQAVIANTNVKYDDTSVIARSPDKSGRRSNPNHYLMRMLEIATPPAFGRMARNDSYALLLNALVLVDRTTMVAYYCAGELKSNRIMDTA